MFFPVLLSSIGLKKTTTQRSIKSRRLEREETEFWWVFLLVFSKCCHLHRNSSSDVDDKENEGVAKYAEKKIKSSAIHIFFLYSD